MSNTAKEAYDEVLRILESEPEYWFDFRFFVKAGTYHEASEKIIKYLPESTEDIWYTVARARI